MTQANLIAALGIAMVDQMWRQAGVERRAAKRKAQRERRFGDCRLATGPRSPLPFRAL